MVKIVVLASFNMDLVMRTPRQPAAGETLQGEFAMHLGGKGFNQAVAARRLGAEVGVIGRVGDDEFGRRFLDALDQEGIDRRHVSIDHEIGTGVASIIVDESGENAIVQAPRANRRLSPAHISAALPAFTHADCALLCLETSDDAAIAFARAGRAAGIRTILNPAPAAPVHEELLTLADVIVANELEAATLVGAAVRTTEDAVEAASLLQSKTGAHAIITLGAEGAVLAHDDATSHAPPHEVHAIDSVGAGDAFCAALAVALSEGVAIADAMAFANAAGALATTKHGAYPSMPYRNDVESLLAKGVTT
jgi:ribokinase